MKKYKEILEMLELLASEFKLAKSQMRTDRNFLVQRMGDKLVLGQCSQEEYNFIVKICNQETEQDNIILKRANDLINAIKNKE